MSDFLKKELGIAMSGVKWDVAGFKIWQSTDPNILLFQTAQPHLAKGANGRYQFAVSQYKQQVDDTFKVTGGSSLFTITSAIQYTAEKFAAVKEQWLEEMRSGENADLVPKSPRFIPLNIRNGMANVLIDPQAGTPDPAHNEKDIGTPGGTNSFLVKLTELGAQEWVQAVKNKASLPVGVQLSYEYLRMMPTVGAKVRVHGKRMFRHISTELKASYSGLYYGGSAQIGAAWEKMVRDGTVEITFIGNGLDPELEKIRQELVSTFAAQAQQQLFNSLFQPKPVVKDAEAGNSGGFFGGANFAFKYRKEEEVTDLNLEIKFEGWTWLKASMDADLTSMISELDESYINEINSQMTTEASIVADSDPMLEHIAVSWTASEGKAPQTPVFGEEGGVERYRVTSQNVNDVEISWTAKLNYTPSNWPVIIQKGKSTIANGGNQVVIKPSAWVGRHKVFLFVQGDDGNIDLMPSDNTFLVCNVSFTGPHIPQSIKASAQITPMDMLEFSYPLSPEGNGGTAKFSAFGIVNGRMVRARDQEINFDEEAVFILASSSGIQLVSENTVFPESEPRNSLARRLLESGVNPVVSKTGEEQLLRPGSNNGTLIRGTLSEIRYSKGLPELIVKMKNGSQRSCHFEKYEAAKDFDDNIGSQVNVEVNQANLIESIAVFL